MLMSQGGEWAEKWANVTGSLPGRATIDDLSADGSPAPRAAPTQPRPRPKWGRIALLCLAAAACGSGAERRCLEAQAHADEGRAARVRGLLASVRSELAPSVEDTLCFGEGPGAVTHAGVVVLPVAAGDAEAAARLAHLVAHRRRPPWPEDASLDQDCDVLVARALAEEARAHVQELEVRAALGVETPAHVFDNEAAIMALPAAARVEAMQAHLRAHPEGGGGYEPLGGDYRRRCEALSR